MTSRISGSSGFNLSNLTANLKAEQTTLPKVVIENHVLQTTINNPNDALAARTGTSYNAQRYKLETQLGAQTNNDPPKPKFETVGGSWRVKSDELSSNPPPKFYCDGDDTTGTVRFDQEYYQPADSKAGDPWVHLNRTGGLTQSPEYKNKVRPEGMSDFEWRGWGSVKASDVPGDITADGKTVSFENVSLAENQLNVLKRYLVDNNLMPGGCDDRKLQDIFGAQVGNEIKLELEKVDEANGKTVFSVHISNEGMAKLREGLARYNAEVQAEATGGAEGQREATLMAADIPGAVYEIGRKVVDGTINVVQDSLNAVLFPPVAPRTGREPNFG